MTDSDNLYKILSASDIEFNGRGEGDGTERIQVHSGSYTTEFTFNPEGKLVNVEVLP